MNALAALPDQTLRDLAHALERRVLRSPFHSTAVEAAVPFMVAQPGAVERVSAALTSVLAAGGTEVTVAATLRAMVASRAAVSSVSERVQLVASGPAGPLGRDTGVLVRELFEGADHEVIVVGYVATKGKGIFEALHERWRERPGMSVTFCLNVGRKDFGDHRDAAEILKEFRAELTSSIWPWTPRPRVFFDPRALIPWGKAERASMHAKAVVVDAERALLTSANFTEAAQERNIELGAVIRDAAFARSVKAHFETLISSGVLRELVP